MTPEQRISQLERDVQELMRIVEQQKLIPFDNQQIATIQNDLIITYGDIDTSDTTVIGAKRATINGIQYKIAVIEV